MKTLTLRNAIYENLKPKAGFLVGLFCAAILIATSLIPSSAAASSLMKPYNNLGLVGYWSFNDGSGIKAVDFSGNGYVGTLQNAPTWVPGKVGKALLFNTASSSYVSTGLTQNLTTYTWAAWVKPTNTTSEDIINDDTGTNQGHSFQLLNGVTPSIHNCSAGCVDVKSSGTVRQNQWSHVAVSVTGGVATYYINGVAAGGGGTGIGGNGGAIGIGQTGGGSFGFTGSIDDVRVYNRALSSTEISALYAMTAGVKLKPKVIAYPALPTTLNLDFETSSSAGLCPYGWSCSGDATTASSANGEGCGAAGGIQGTYYLKAGCDTTIGTAISTPFYLPSTISYVSFLRAGGAPGPGSGLYVVRASDNAVLCSAETGTQTDTFFTDNSCAGLSSYAGQPAYIKVVDNYSGGWGKVYVDNILLKNSGGTTLASPTMYQAISTSTVYGVNRSQNITRSSLDNGLLGLWSFNGADMSTSTAYDRSGNGNNGTLVNAPVPTIGKSGQALAFDGSSSYVKLPSMTVTGGRSVSAWIKLNTINRRNIIFGQYGGYVFFVESNNLLSIYDGSEYSPSPALAAGTWYHVVVTTNTATSPYTHTLYLNGVSIGSTQGAGSGNISGIYTIGDQYQNAEHFAGTIDEVRLYNRVLSASEVSRLYNMGK